MEVINSARPTEKIISDALERKYGLRVSYMGLVLENWEIQEV